MTSTIKIATVAQFLREDPRNCCSRIVLVSQGLPHRRQGRGPRGRPQRTDRGSESVVDILRGLEGEIPDQNLYSLSSFNLLSCSHSIRMEELRVPGNSVCWVVLSNGDL
jgi:hypothetical protein